MKIAIIVGEFPSVSETFILNQIVSLIENGHSVKIFALRRNNEVVLHQKILDFDLLSKTKFYTDKHTSKISRYVSFVKDCLIYRTRIDWRLLLKKFNIKKYGKQALSLNFYLKTKWLMEQGKLDIIHAHFGPVATEIADAKIFFKTSKFVVSFHGYDLTPQISALYKRKYENLFQTFDLILLNNDYSASLLKRITDCRKVQTLPVGLDTNFFKKVNLIRKSGFNLLFVGRLIELKGPHLAIEIVKKILSKHNFKLRLTIVGDGPMKSTLENMVKDYALQDVVDLKGALSQEEIKNEMSKADVFLFPGIQDLLGRAETQGLVIQEAQAMELPVIISDVGGMKYGVIDGTTGYVVIEKNINCFVKKALFLIMNPKIKEQMGSAGRTFVVDNYDSDFLTKKLIGIYRELITI